jgi:GT2 family glycosyltransferase
MNMVKTPLQSLLWPDPAFSTERELYMRLGVGAALSMSKNEISFVSGGFANFATYANLFNVGKWHKYCGLEQLSLHLTGTGRFELVVFHAVPEHSYTRLVNEMITLKEGVPQRFELTHPRGFDSRGVVFFELRALADGTLVEAEWHSDMPAKRTPDLMLSITTFKREKAVQATVARFKEFVRDTLIKDHIHLTVVDNGQSADISASDHVTLIPNENLGGAGGFARGLVEARARGASHCLFMDDDAACHFGALERTWMFLAHAIDPKVAVSGALINAQHRWMLWENGAIFDKLCYPEFNGLDLRNLDHLIGMEVAGTADKPANFYGGWWYFAFPVDQAKHMPFPFFVRGDDVSFSLMNDLRIVTLSGVTCFQDEDFSTKETPLTLYLDLRGHLSHHVVAPQLDQGRKGLSKILGWFFFRSLLSCHYETLAALGLALRDFIEGPEYFARNADMQQRRAEIKALTQIELWRPLEGDLPQEKRRFRPENRWHRILMKATLNGHLLPFFSRFGNHITLPSHLRGHRRPIWGASQITYVTPDRRLAYTARHDKAHAFRVTSRFCVSVWVLMTQYKTVRDRWRKGYDALTLGSFWHDVLNIKPTNPSDS